MDTAVQQLQSAVDALREVFEWPGIVIFAKKIQEDPRSVLFRRRMGCSKKQGLSWRATARPRLGADFRGWFYRRCIQIPNLGTGYDGVKLWNPRRKSSNAAQVREKLHVYSLQDLTVVGTKTPSKKKWCLGMVKIKPNTAEAPTGCPASRCDATVNLQEIQCIPSRTTRCWTHMAAGSCVWHVNTNQLEDQALVIRKEIRIW